MLDLPPEIEALLREQAQNAGLSPSDYLARLINEEKAAKEPRDTPKPKDGSDTLTAPVNSTDALFNQWDVEDARMTEEERREEDRFWAEFTDGIDQNRAAAGMRSLF